MRPHGSLFIGILLVVVAISACSETGDDVECHDGKCDDGDTCGDERYGNGVCDTSLDCATPDIDCFRTFQSDEEAMAWYIKWERAMTGESGTTPRSILSPEDPRFPAARKTLDRIWEAFRASRPVASLADARPALVLLEFSSPNAFVVPDLDLQHAAFAVMLHTGFLTTAHSEEALSGVLAHELQHVVGLHVLPGTNERVQTFYVAHEDSEPIGRLQEDDADVRAAGAPWIAAAAEVGRSSSSTFGGMPLSGALFNILVRAIDYGLRTNPSACERSSDFFNSFESGVKFATDPLSGEIWPAPYFSDDVANLYTSLRDECLAGVTTGFVEFVAELTGFTVEDVHAWLTDEDRALVSNVHVIDAIVRLGEDRRAKMRAIEAAFAHDVGRPWTALRYFSTEEDADDVSVSVMRTAGLDPTGLVSALEGSFDGHLGACRKIIDEGGVPAYGADLVDAHHAPCFRIYHTEAYAGESLNRAHVVPSPSVVASTRSRFPPRLADLVMH